MLEPEPLLGSLGMRTGEWLLGGRAVAGGGGRAATRHPGEGPPTRVEETTGWVLVDCAGNRGRRCSIYWLGQVKHFVGKSSCCVPLNTDFHHLAQRRMVELSPEVNMPVAELNATKFSLMTNSDMEKISSASIIEMCDVTNAKLGLPNGAPQCATCVSQSVRD